MKASVEEQLKALDAIPSIIPIGRKLSVTISRPKKSYKHDKSTQTIYRESETQTLPWSPEVIFRRRRDGARIPVELLGVPGEGPLAMEDLIVIERARQKNAWEDTLPRTSSKRNNVVRLSCITSIVVNEMAFREAILDAECEERLVRSKSSLKQGIEQKLSKLETRLRNIRNEKSKENTQVLEYRKHQLKRNIRKLKFDGEKERCQYETSPRNFCDSVRSSRSRSLTRDETGFSRYLAEFSGVELLEKQIALSSLKFFKSKKPSRPKTTCSRAAKKTANELKKLGTDLTGKESSDEDEAPEASLRRRIRYSFRGKCKKDSTALEKEEEMYQACLLLGKIVKGRAVQTRLFSEIIELRSRKSKLSRLITGNIPYFSYFIYLSFLV